MSAHNLAAGSWLAQASRASVATCGAHANAEGDRRCGGVPLLHNGGGAVLTLIAGQGARARAR